MRSACSLVLLFAVTLFAGAQTPTTTQQPAPESPEVQPGTARALQAHVFDLFQSGQYAQIDALAQQLRTQHTRLRGGNWQLNFLYQVINSPGAVTATDADWQALIAKLQSWIASNPQSPTPRIALSGAYVAFAWKARGNGYIKTVTPEGWTLFNQRIQNARTALEDARDISVNCPEWYRGMQYIGMAQGWPRSQMDTLAQTALARNPEYFYIAFGQAENLLPKWHGKPGETETYAAQVADTIGGREGDAVYFLIADHLNCCGRPEAPAMDEARVQRGFSALSQLYGYTNGYLNSAAFMALRAGDTATAQQLFAKIGDDWFAGVWGSKARFDASRSGQPVGGIPPVGPVTTAPINQGVQDSPNK